MSNDTDRTERVIRAARIVNDESYQVGVSGVTEIKWGWTSGSMADLQTIQVFKGEKMFSEHPFINALSVVYQ